MQRLGLEAIPNELLRVIFVEACTAVDKEELSALDMRACRWTIGQVCGLWREIALSCPQMWDDLEVMVSSSSRDGNRLMFQARCGKRLLPSKSADILQEHLSRSRNSSISVKMHCSAVYSEIDERKGAELFRLVGGYSEKWKDASLKMQEKSMNQALFTQVNGRLSRLEKLSWDPLPYPLPNTIVAPCLRDIDIGQASITRSFPQWAQLQRILSNYPWHDDLRALQQCHHLHQLRLLNLRSQTVQPELIFAHLRVLTCTPSALKVFLELPSLEELHLYDHDPNLAATIAFIQRLSPRLTSFTFPTSYKSSDLECYIAIDILKMLPGLKTLNILRFEGHGTKIIKYLTVDSNHLDDAVLPELQHIKLETPDVEKICSSIKMIESRFFVLGLKSVEWWKDV
ncbi:hypothetical protein C8J56DRAFT_988039 [Mycena floridula]|nr:hypothetical protein C8J56DRAFT_988039 [Mycena floridula]